MLIEVGLKLFVIVGAMLVPATSVSCPYCAAVKAGFGLKLDVPLAVITPLASGVNAVARTCMPLNVRVQVLPPELIALTVVVMVFPLRTAGLLVIKLLPEPLQATETV